MDTIPCVHGTKTCLGIISWARLPDESTGRQGRGSSAAVPSVKNLCSGEDQICTTTAAHNTLN